ncbi:MAG: acyltransferase [Puniceicoccales bacterium]|jgi:hypothetical protein|nr:acyltransferase [Puniceicoccales bacterium]
MASSGGIGEAGGRPGADDLQSRVISALRFPLIVGVLLIHTRVRPGAGADGFFFYIEALFSRVIGHVSVPLFFFFSGYLFFRGPNPGAGKGGVSAASNGIFPSSWWLAKLRGRVRTLLLPYVLWVGGWAVLYAVLVKTGLIGASRPLDARFFLHAFWDVEADADGTRPLAGQFWFLRDLMCAVLLAPALGFLAARRIGAAVVLALGLLWFFDAQGSPVVTRIPFLGDRGLSHWVLFFFTAGAWFSIRGRNFLADSGRFAPGVFILYPALVLADLLTIRQPWNFAIHRAGILAAMPFFILSAARLSRPGAGRPFRPGRAAFVADFLRSASFFVYAAHGPALLFALERFFLRPLAPKGDPALAASYLGALALELVATLGAFAALRRLCPRLLCLLTGGAR